MIIAKGQEVQVNGQYTLYDVVDVIDDLTGEKIGTKNQLIGSYSIDQLENEKAMYQWIIDWIEEKIDAIESIQGQE